MNIGSSIAGQRVLVTLDGNRAAKCVEAYNSWTVKEAQDSNAEFRKQTHGKQLVAVGTAIKNSWLTVEEAKELFKFTFISREQSSRKTKVSRTTGLVTHTTFWGLTRPTHRGFDQYPEWVPLKSRHENAKNLSYAEERSSVFVWEGHQENLVTLVDSYITPIFTSTARI